MSSAGDWVPVRLCDLPAELRTDAATSLLQYAADADEALELLTASLEPSDTTYWVPRAAVERVLGKRVARADGRDTIPPSPGDG